MLDNAWFELHTSVDYPAMNSFALYLARSKRIINCNALHGLPQAFYTLTAMKAGLHCLLAHKVSTNGRLTST